MASRVLALAGVLAVASLGLQGCNGKDDTPADVTTTTTITTTTKVAPQPQPPAPEKPLRPIRGVSYEVPPCLDLLHGIPAKDYMQAGYSMQWGPMGRDDLGMISLLGGNAVRLYHGLGLETSNHSLFLDRAHELGLHVIVGFHTQNICPGFNCFAAWKQAAASGFKAGFARNGSWHPAVTTVVLMDQPDGLNFFENHNGDMPSCGNATDQEKAVCRTRAVISALEGLLAAEMDAGVSGHGVQITAAWSFDMSISIDGVINTSVPAIWGFQDVYAGTKNPSLAKYVQQSPLSLKNAYDARWVHSVNAPSFWSYIKEFVFDTFHNGSDYATRPWFVSGFLPTGDDEDVTQDLKDMDEAAKDGSFLGTVFKGFQVDYTQEPPSTFGLFGLGNRKLTEVTSCETDVLSGHTDCHTFDVFCLNSTGGNQLDYLTQAWSGTSFGHGSCLTSWEDQEGEEEYVVV